MEEEEVADVFRTYGLPGEQIIPIVEALSADWGKWVDFMMRFELGMEAPDPARSRQSALTIALSYIFGDLIPLMPYIQLKDLHTALLVSVGVTLLALFLFGFIKGRFTGLNPFKSDMQTFPVGGLAAAVALVWRG